MPDDPSSMPPWLSAHAWRWVVLHGLQRGCRCAPAAARVVPVVTPQPGDLEAGVTTWTVRVIHATARCPVLAGGDPRYGAIEVA